MPEVNSEYDVSYEALVSVRSAARELVYPLVQVGVSARTTDLVGWVSVALRTVDHAASQATASLREVVRYRLVRPEAGPDGQARVQRVSTNVILDKN